jgi:threonylcarbamoyladenosine tRNA methylthiotransferase MtaB
MDMKGKRVAFATLGCKLNYAETSTIARQMQDAGMIRVPFKNEADVVVINTCSVTQSADKKCRQAITRATSISPEAIVAVIGCYSQLKADEIAAIPGVDLVLGTKEKFRIIEHLHRRNNDGPPLIQACGIEEVLNYDASYSISDRTRAFLKVQDGCDYQCSYCTIPLARGSSRNQNIAETVKLATEIAAKGTREIVLTGVNIGDFGRSSGEHFYDLLLALDRVEGIARYRISSIEPNLLNNEIIRFVATSSRFVPHFHIPLQSGCNEILGKMRRRYRRELFAERVHYIKEIMPRACIGADVIAGFPGETEELFKETFDFLSGLPLSYLHAFTFSERKNTLAADLPEKVPPVVKDARTRQLISLSEDKRLAFYMENLELNLPVLFESARKDGKMFGFTDSYIKVEIPFQKELVNELRTVRLTGITSSGNVNGIPA